MRNAACGVSSLSICRDVPIIQRINTSAIALSAICALALAGCANFLPASGPYATEVEAHRPVPEGGVDYGLVKVTPEVVDVLATTEPKGLAGAFTERQKPAKLYIGIGDTVSVTIFEAAAGGLFIPAEAGVRPGNYVTIPDQAVDNEGYISVPYAGLIKASGKTPPEVQGEIVNAIKGRAIEPQATVSVVNQRTQLISVLGEVNSPARYPAAASGADDKVLDAITRAGGIKGQGFETWVILERGNKRAAVPFENLITNPSNNVYVRPNDRIYVYREQQQFMALGATGLSGQYNFDAWRLSLAQALGKTGGLLDGQAEPAGVFLYRREPRDVAARLGVDVDRFSGPSIPVIFRVDLRDPAGFFLATKIEMRNQDVIFVANSNSVELTKFFQFVNTVSATTVNSVNTARLIRLTQ